MAEIEINNSELFHQFLEKHLKAATYDGDAYLEKLIIHWGETGEKYFTLPAEETVSGQEETIAFSAKTRYYIREGGKEIPIDDLSEGYDVEKYFTLPAEETVSGQEETIAFSAKTRYYIREGGKEIPIDDLSEGYDVYRPVLEFTSAEAVIPETLAPSATLNPIALLRHKSGRTLKAVCATSGLSPETLLEYEKPGFNVGQLPLATAAAIAKALGVHAEALLSCGPAMPRNR